MNAPESPPPPRRYTSPTGRIVIPVLLVVLLIVVLGRPILISGLDLDTEDPSPVPTHGRRNGNGDAGGPTRLSSAYPKACLQRDRDDGPGSIAAYSGGSVAAASPTGQRAFALRAKAPIGWSASGSFLATAGADIWSSRGNHIGTAFSRPVRSWAWSPVADCIVGIERERLVVAEPQKRAELLLRGLPITTFAFSPSGARLVFTVDADARRSGIWMADLVTREVKILQSSLGWVLVGWSRADRPILFRQGTVDAPGGTDLSFMPPDLIAPCGNEIVTISNDRLANLGITEGPEYLPADRRFRYTAVACSPNGRFLVTVRYLKGTPGATQLAVLRPDGSFVREVGMQSGTEDLPMWGSGGVVFAGTVGGEGAAGPLVWFLPEGGTARTTGLRVERLGDDLEMWLDWSATPPLGYPSD